MKAIYDAIRAAKDLRKADEGIFLRTFERRTRGHSHELAALCRHWSAKPVRNELQDQSLDDQFRTRLTSVHDSTRVLLGGLIDYLPGSARSKEEWAPILDAVDNTGVLRTTLLNRISHWPWLNSSRRKQWGSASTVSAWVSGPPERHHVVLAVKAIGGSRDELRAERTVTVPQSFSGQELDTLRGCLIAYEAVCREIDELFQYRENFPEFSEKARQVHDETDLRQRFATRMQAHFSSAELGWLRQNLNSLEF